MELTVLGSSSRGNAYVLQNAGEALLIEAGINFKEVVKALGYDVEKVQGCLVSHEHGDHAGHINEVLAYGLPVYASAGTIDGAQRFIKTDYKPIAFYKDESGYKPLSLGRFEVIPFPTQHDAQEPTGFYIWHAETGGVLFATDTYYINNRFEGLNNILLECNYDQEQLEANLMAGTIDAARYRRIRESHLSIDQCIATLLANDLKHVNNIVLIHLSADNGNAYRFRQRVAAATHKRVTVAEPGLKICFNKEPF